MSSSSTDPLLAAPVGEPAAPKRPLRKVLSGFLLTISVVLLKLKAVLLLIVAKFKPLFVNPVEGFSAMQFAVAGGSMLVTIVTYAIKMPLGFVLGFVLITLIHELGHAVVIKARGLRAGLMLFIPFVGGAVTLKDQPRSAWVDAQIGLAGPVAGTIASLISLQIFKWTGSPLYLAVAFAGFLINLLNLLPIGVLDGGRVSGAISKWMWLFGGAALVYKTFKQQNPLLIVLLVLSAFQVYNSIVHEKDSKFYEVTGAQRATVAVAYFALVVFIGHQAMMSYDRLQSFQP